VPIEYENEPSKYEKETKTNVKIKSKFVLIRLKTKSIDIPNNKAIARWGLSRNIKTVLRVLLRFPLSKIKPIVNNASVKSLRASSEKKNINGLAINIKCQSLSTKPLSKMIFFDL
jgi:hypothetical protein